MRLQRTLKTAVEFSGIGLHSGERIDARVLPAPPGTGVEFIRTDLSDAPPIPAHIAYRSPKERRTRLQRGSAQVDTVEHLLAACSGLQVDNLVVELSGQEMPGMDGSSLPFVELLQRAGFAEQRSPARVFRLDEPIYVREGDATLVALPSDEPSLTLQYVASFNEPGVSGGSITCRVDAESFVRDIAPARTFCLASEVEALQAAGLGKGATRENTVVLGDPEATMRVADEPVRHKLLDLLGDLHLLGAELHAHVIATRSGHALNAELVRRLQDRMQKLETGGFITRESGLDISEVMKMLPHRYPFLLIDRVLEIDGYSRAVAIKNVSINEPFFVGHFPDAPIMPGVLQLEAMAQLAGVLILRKMENTGKLAALWAIDKVKLRGRVVPGDQLRLEVETTRMKGEIAQVRGTASVAGKTVSEAVLTFTMIDA
ncbi:UDP-3-O-acyl-N-acetylglucosamine deacetylase [Engelhardtia mirabilis]|uniref:Multifunctional fusion protein n=1 Tax=Engelhardtia mirabilis TaxID=2528011 RepID=A0A518BPK0_9BACT|nr:UDP-3-O-[3-hydroxymyristoyl] N-acetylglucosamine deacetylase [Planctomycetes bacterium Pla133]QDV03213.1 UDP-3-O-[3-hydroxymyristoyl] N-acetylglucosamine deacetylase [Planctomycetes bacterium Pla86]